MYQRIAAAVLFAAIVVVAVEPMLLSLPFRDRERMARGYATIPDHGYPEYRAFVESVRDRTLPGDSIAILVPWLGWQTGYSDAYYRASYYLAGREVLPLVYPYVRGAAENFRTAKYIAAWRVRVLPPGEVVMRAHGGALVKRR